MDNELINEQKNVAYHFIGIGGIGMSAIAKILVQNKQIVKGSDIKSNKVIDELIQDGANIQIGHKGDFVQKDDIIVVSSAIDNDNPEYQKALEMNLKIVHRSDLLDQIMIGKKPLMITGTHGKTTTTSLVTEVLLQSNLDPSFVIGGILNSKKTNGQKGEGKYFVAEADESDGSFLKTKPFGAIVTNLEKEHLNYWKTFENLTSGFSTFFSNVISKKHLFWCFEDENLRKLNPQGISYGFSKKAKLRAENIRSNNFQMIFDIRFKNKVFKDVKINLIGKHSVLNALAVFGLTYQLKIDENNIRKALENFQGVSRRLEKVNESQNTIFFDDYAHHPTEIESTLKSLRQQIQERKLICIFQPHRYSRLNDLFDEFTKAFEDVDELIITNIYSANEKPIENVTSERLVELIKKRDIDVLHIPDDLLEEYILKNVKPFDVVIAMGAGDISSKIRKISNVYVQKPKKLTVGIIYGGKSNEHEITIRSTKNFSAAFDKSIYDLKYFKITKDGSWILDKNEMPVNDKSNSSVTFEILNELKTCDVCFPILHGPFGEDGMIGAFLDTLDIPFIGTDYFTSPIAMDKAFSKIVAKANKVPILDFIEINSYLWKDNKDFYVSKILKKFNLPVYIKPNHLGSSLGIKIVDDKEKLKEALDYVFTFDTSLIIEESLPDVREIQSAVIGNDYIIIGELGEIINQGHFFDYQGKYGQSSATSKLPIDVSEHKIKEIKEMAIKVYQALKISGFSRIDMFLDKDLNVYFNEINPIPGFSSANSMFPRMLSYIGIDNKNMVDRFVIYAFHRKRKNKRLTKAEL